MYMYCKIVQTYMGYSSYGNYCIEDNLNCENTFLMHCSALAQCKWYCPIASNRTAISMRTNMLEEIQMHTFMQDTIIAQLIGTV